MFRKVLIIITAVIFLASSAIVLDYFRVPEIVMAKASILVTGKAVTTPNYTLSHSGSQGVVTDPAQCLIYGKFTNNNGSTGSLNYRIYIDDVFTGTFASASGGSFKVNLNSTCVRRFGDNVCVNFETKFTHNVAHTIKIQVNVSDSVWEYADDDAPFPKNLNCQEPSGTTTLVPTLTRTPTKTATLTKTPIPTKTPTPTKVPPTRTPTKTATKLPPTKTPTKTATSTLVPFKIQNSIMYTTNFAYPDLGCNWLGIAGQVMNKTGNPYVDVVVVVEGMIGSEGYAWIGLTGLAPAYGPGGYEIQISEAPFNSTEPFYITLYDLDSNQLSDTLSFSTYDDCSKNLIIANFTMR
jgi:hypothetical protein